MEKLLENRIHLAHLPTPIQFMPRLSDELGVKLYIKRDDLTESIGSGNKIRKLEYLLHDAVQKKADTLVSCGGIQSNHCRAVAWASAKAGLSCVWPAGENQRRSKAIDCWTGYITTEIF